MNVLGMVRRGEVIDQSSGVIMQKSILLTVQQRIDAHIVDNGDTQAHLTKAVAIVP